MMKLLRCTSLTVTMILFSFQIWSQCNDPFPPGTGPNGCNNAPLFCSEAEFDGFCSNTAPSGVGLCPADFCGSCENYHWFSFIANSPTIQLEIEPSNCIGTGMGSGLQAHMYETNDCVNFNPVSNCESPGVEQVITVTGNNLNVGQVYFLMIDGWAGDVCDYTIDVLQGIGDVPPPIIPGGITGTLQVCPGAMIDYSVPPSSTASNYEWTLVPPIGSIGGNGTPNATITYNAPGTAQLCVTPSNACDEGPPVCTTVISTLIPPTFCEADICIGPGESVVCGGVTFTNPGVYQETYETALGCDSNVTYIISPIIVPSPIIFDTLCAGECYTLNGNDYCQSGGFQETFTSFEGCDSTVNLILFVLEAEAIIATPPLLGCGASTITLDASQSTTTPASNQTILTYQWTGPGIVGPNNILNIDVNAPGTYTLTVTQSMGDVVCTDMASVTVVEDTTVPDPPLLNGPNSSCSGITDTYTVNPAGTGPAPDGYTWTVTGGTFVDNGTSIDVTWTSITTGQVCVTADNDCGSSPQVCIDVTLGQGAADPMIMGNALVCEGDVAVYMVDPVDPTAMYAWTVSGGASFTNNGSSIDVDFSGATDGQICVTATNACGVSNQICLPFTVEDVPANPVITGDAAICDGQVGSYSVPNDPTATNFTWVTPNGEPITGQGTNAITVDWIGSAGGDVCVQASNGCGNSQTVCFDVTVNQAPQAQIQGGGEFCAGSGDVINLTIQLAGTAPWTVEINDGTSTFTLPPINNSPFILPVTNPGTYTLVSVDDATGCPGQVGGGMAVVTENPLPTAMISGDGSICQGSGDCVPMNIDLTGTPNWTIVIARGLDTLAPITGVMTSPFTYNNACQAGTYTIVSVTDGNGCTNAGTGSGTVTVDTAPIVSGIDPDNCDPTNTTYTVTFQISGGDPGSYTVNGSTAGITGGPPFTFTSGPINSGSSYNFVVTDANDCNPVTVSGTFFCDCTTDVGMMDQMAMSACGTDCITASYDPTGEAFDGDDVIEYVLHTGSGLSITGEIARNSIPEFCYDATAGMVFGTTYYISAVIGNDDGTGSVDLTDPCLAVAQGTPVVFFEVPTADLSGDVTICEGESADLTITFTGPSPYQVVYTDGANNTTLNGIISNPYTLTVTPPADASYNLVSTANDNCPGTVSGAGSVTVNTAPVVANVSTDCNATSTGFTVTFEITGSDAGSYEVLPAGSGTLTPGTPAIFTSNLIASPATYSFEVTDANGCDTILVDTQVPVQCVCSTVVGTMVGTPVEECGDGPVTVAYDPTGEFLDGDDVQEFVLHNGSGVNIGYPILARSDMPTFSFDGATMDYGTTYYISAIVGNDDGTGSVDDMGDPCLEVAVGIPVTFYEVPTATLSGDAEICRTEAVDLTITLTGDAPWDFVIQNDVTGVTDTVTGVNSTTVDYTVAPVITTSYTLLAVNDENCPGTPAGTVTVTVNEAPTVSTPEVTINASNTGFTVCFDINGGEAPYSVTSGGMTVMVDSAFCSMTIPCSAGMYSFSVDDANACGPTVVSDVVLCNCLSTAGDMQIDTISICGTGPAVATYDDTNQVLDGNDVVDYILHNGDLVPIQTSAMPSFTFNGALIHGQVYFITARVGDNNGSGNVNPNDPCLSYSNNTPVVFYQIPNASLSGGDEICAGECIDLSLSISGGVAPWFITYSNNLGQMFTDTINNANAVITVCPPASTFYTLNSITDQNCSGQASGVASVQIQGIPFAINVTETIDPTNTFVEVCFDIIGGDPTSYVVGGGPGTIDMNNSFCSDPIPCDQPSYLFLVQDGFSCVTDTVQGIIECPCQSNAGIMSGNANSVCEFESISVTSTVGQSLDANDVLNYVLHTQNNDMLGTILAINPISPAFDYDPTILDCDVTYYISAIAGDDDGTGFVDLTDDCLSVAEGTPIQFNCLPEASFSGTTAICEGETASITFGLSGEGPFNITIQINGTDTLLEDIGDGEMLMVNPSATTTYTLVDIEDVTTGCINTATGSVTITVNTLPDAGMAMTAMEFCEGSTTVVNLFDQLTGEDAGGTWTDVSNVSAPAGAFNAGAGTFNIAGVPANTYEFEYAIAGVAPCPDASAVVTVIVDPLPVADAGADQEVSCDNEAVTIGGPATTVGPNIVYEWVDQQGAIVSTARTFEVSTAGTFTLTVSDAVTGCTSTDQVSVIENISVPIPMISLSDVSCFGEDDGFIVIDSIAGGVGPYLCSFNGGDFTQQKQFLNLSAGAYTILVQDSKGCEFEVTIDLLQPDELTVELVANFEGDDNFIELGDSLQVMVELNIPFEELDSVIWSPAEFLSCDTCETVMVSPQNATTFSIYVENDGCTDTDDLRVLVRKTRPVFIPNIFSPDGDNINDVFFIQAGQSVTSVRAFQVFNRWGETVYEYYNFQPNNPNIGGWDGTFRGEVMDPAVFVYYAEIEFIDGLIEIFKGDVTLLR